MRKELTLALFAAVVLAACKKDPDPSVGGGRLPVPPTLRPAGPSFSASSAYAGQ